MASKRTTVETTEAAAFDEAQPIIAEGITRVMEAHGITMQHARYKAMRAIAFQAFVNAIEAGTFDDLVEQAIDNAGNLPTGWKLEGITAAPSSKPAVKKAAPAKGSTKPAATTRTRKPAAKAEA